MKRRSRKRTPFAVIGAGRAGLALAAALRRSGYALTGIVSRDRKSASRASRWIGRGAGTVDPAAAVSPAKVVLICVPDGEITRAAETIAAIPAPGLAGKVVLHTSGALTAATLEPARRAGAHVGSFHPLVSFPEPGVARPDLRGITFGLDGDPPAIRAGRAMTRALGGVPFLVPADARGAYHLTASLAANGLVALVEEAIQLAVRRLGMSEQRAHETLLPLVLSAVFNVAGSGTRRALTGPVARGDGETVARHLQELSREDPSLGDLYRILSARALGMARDGGRLDPESAERLERLLRRD